MRLEQDNVVIGPWVAKDDAQEAIKILSEILSQVVNGEIVHLTIQAKKACGRTENYCARSSGN